MYDCMCALNCMSCCHYGVIKHNNNNNIGDAYSEWFTGVSTWRCMCDVCVCGRCSAAAVRSSLYRAPACRSVSVRSPAVDRGHAGRPAGSRPSDLAAQRRPTLPITTRLSRLPPLSRNYFPASSQHRENASRRRSTYATFVRLFLFFSHFTECANKISK